MAISKKDLYRMIDHLNENENKVVYDFVKSLLERSKNEQNKKFWQDIENQSPDIDKLSKEEIEQLESDEGYLTGEDAKREFGIQVDLP